MEPHRVVEILKNGESLGSGFFVTKSHVLTAKHVVKPTQIGTACEIWPLCAFESERFGAAVLRPPRLKGRVDWISADEDFAILAMDGAADSTEPCDLVTFGWSWTVDLLAWVSTPVIPSVYLRFVQYFFYSAVPRRGL